MANDNSNLVVAALVRTDPLLAGDIDAQNSWATEIMKEGARVALYRKYEEGEHRSGITPQMKRMLRLGDEESGLDDFNDNYCGIIVDKMSGRLHISRITTKSEDVDNNWLNPILERNDWEALQGRTYRGAIRDGDSYIAVDPETLQWITEPSYDGFSGIVAIHSQSSKTPAWACKLWSESAGKESEKAIIHLIVYQPHQITFWVGEEGGKEVRPEASTMNITASDNVDITSAADESQVVLEDQGNGFSLAQEVDNIIPWTLGRVPIVHFANKIDNYDDSGKSEIRVAIPLQDALNRTLHSMVMASEFSAFRIKWSIGLEINAEEIVPGAVVNLVLIDDQTKKPITQLDEATAKFLAAVRVGQFEETDMAQYIVQIDKLAREISQVSQTPIYGVTTEGVLSGEALKQLEIGLIGKVERFQRDNSDAVRELIQLTAMIQNTFSTGLGNAPQIQTISIQWKPAELLDTNAQVTMLINMRKSAPGLWDDSFYRKMIGSLMGMSEDDVKTEDAVAKQAQTNTLETLIGGGTGRTVPVV